MKELISTVGKSAKRLIATYDPFEISIKERDSLDANQVVALYDILLEKYGNMIYESLKNSRFIVLCDKKIVLTSNNPEGPSNDEIISLERKYGKVCYVITRDLIEESRWGMIDNDYYPTIPIFLGADEWIDQDVFSRGLCIDVDFDTGNPSVASFNSEELYFLRDPEAFEVRRALHLGRFYDYYLRSVKVGIQDIRGYRRCMLKNCRCVLFWNVAERNPFLLANTRRKGFVGRDIMIKISFDVILSPLTKSSKLCLNI